MEQFTRNQVLEAIKFAICEIESEANDLIQIAVYGEPEMFKTNKSANQLLSEFEYYLKLNPSAYAS